MERHADFALSVSQKLDVETSSDPGDGKPPVAGRVLALVWWVNAARAGEDWIPTGTLYLVADQRRPRPYWVKQADLTAIRLVE